MLKIAITGVAGMVGSHLSQILINKGYELVGIDNLKVGSKDKIKEIISDKNFKFFSFDIRDKALLKKNIQNCDMIVHLAAIKKLLNLKVHLKSLM